MLLLGKCDAQGNLIKLAMGINMTIMKILKELNGDKNLTEDGKSRCKLGLEPGEGVSGR